MILIAITIDDSLYIVYLDLIECDYFHKHSGCAEPVRCRKVYHQYCLAYEVDDDVNWKCPRHLCDMCGRGNVHYYCVFCPISICKDCPKRMVAAHGNPRYIEIQPLSPIELPENTIPIVCHTCLMMLDKCDSSKFILPAKLMCQLSDRNSKIQLFPGSLSKNTSADIIKPINEVNPSGCSSASKASQSSKAIKRKSDAISSEA